MTDAVTPSFSIEPELIRELLAESIKAEGAKMVRNAVQQEEVRNAIRNALRDSFSNTSPLEKAVRSNLDSAVSRAVWQIFEEAEVTELFVQLVKESITDPSFQESLKAAVQKSVWDATFYVKLADKKIGFEIDGKEVSSH